MDGDRMGIDSSDSGHRESGLNEFDMKILDCVGEAGTSDDGQQRPACLPH